MTTASYVTLKATTNAALVKATTLAVLLRIAATYVNITAVVTVRSAPWDGYAYDYFSEDYTLVLNP